MVSQFITDINIDFIKQKYLMINAKQYDNYSRIIRISCYNDGEFYKKLNSNDHDVYINFKKADGHFVFDFCTIDSNGRVLVTLTEQMLAALGTCYAEIKVVNKGSVKIYADTGAVFVEDPTVITTMTFYVNVCETVVEDSLITSSDAFLELNGTLATLTANFEEAVLAAKSWAVGDTDIDGRAAVEDTDNSKYYSKVSQSYAVGNKYDSTGVKIEGREDESVDNAEYYSRLAKSYAKGNIDGATNIVGRENEAEDNAKYYYELALESAKDSKTSAQNSSDSANLSKSYAVGGTSTRSGEDTDNAKYYYEATNELKWDVYDLKKITESYAVGGTHYRDNEDVDNAKYYCELSKDKALDASTSASKAKTSETNAKTSETNAKTSETNVIISEENARISAHNAAVYAYGGYLEENPNTGEVVLPVEMEGARQFAAEAENYYNQMTTLVEQLNGNAFVPRGTVSFAHLKAITESGDVEVGDLYHIDEKFTTNETFGKGAGYMLEAGTNVYWAANNCWYWLVNVAVTGVKGNNETTYRKGNVNITAANVGAVSIADVSTVSEMKNYLGI